MRPADHHSATIEDIARLAGVSVASVSRALSGQPGVSATTRASIRRIAEEQHYIGNQTARALSAGKSGRVAVTLPFVHAEYFARILAGAAEVFHAAGLSLMLETTGHRHDIQADAIRRIRRLGTDGALLLLPPESPEELQALHDSGFPFVVVDAFDQLTLPSPWITCSHANGARQATEHLLDLGHRRIAVITGEAGFLSTRERLHGVRVAHDAAGVTLDEGLIHERSYTDATGGYDVTVELLRSSRPPTAIFAFNDHLAFGALRAAHECGVEVPGQLSIVGFDDLEAASLVSPSLTTVRQPLGAMGTTAAQILLQLMAGSQQPGMHIQLSTELVVRHSTARSP